MAAVGFDAEEHAALVCAKALSVALRQNQPFEVYARLVRHIISVLPPGHEEVGREFESLLKLCSHEPVPYIPPGESLPSIDAVEDRSPAALVRPGRAHLGGREERSIHPVIVGAQPAGVPRGDRHLYRRI